MNIAVQKFAIVFNVTTRVSFIIPFLSLVGLSIPITPFLPVKGLTCESAPDALAKVGSVFNVKFLFSIVSFTDEKRSF